MGPWDATLITIGSVLGSGIFITTGDIARVLPHGGLILLVWIVGGLLTLAGALTYAELGGMFPKAGGHTTFSRRPMVVSGALSSVGRRFFVIMTGGIAALAVGFGEYLGAYLPFFTHTGYQHFGGKTRGISFWRLDPPSRRAGVHLLAKTKERGMWGYRGDKEIKKASKKSLEIEEKDLYPPIPSLSPYPLFPVLPSMRYDHCRKGGVPCPVKFPVDPFYSRSVAAPPFFRLQPRTLVKPFLATPM